MLSDKEQLRDISSIGLKTVIGELPPASSGKQEHHFLPSSFLLGGIGPPPFLSPGQGGRAVLIKGLCKDPIEQLRKKSLESYFYLKVN